MAFNRADFYDAELRRYNERFRAALGIGPRDRVLDIGCGAGQSSCEAARAASGGSVLGVDISEELLETARWRAREQGLENVDFLLADAQTHAFPAAHFDLCISRFGTMFFADPLAAFRNIAGAMRPAARLVLLVWQSRDRNEWATAIQGVLAPETAPGTQPAPAFSLADPEKTTRLLSAAGFAAIEHAEVHEPVFYGAGVEAAYEAVTGLFLAKNGLVGDGAVPAERLRRLRDLLEAHRSEDGVLFDSHAWIVTATRRAG